MPLHIILKQPAIKVMIFLYFAIIILIRNMKAIEVCLPCESLKSKHTPHSQKKEKKNEVELP